MEGRSYKKKKPNVVNVGKDKIEPANEEDEDGLMSEEIIENEAKDKDCYRYKLFGVPMGKRDIVLSTFKGMELFLFDFDLRLMYGICKATWLEGFRKVVMSCGGQLHTTVSHDGPTETLKRIIMELEKTRSKKNSKKRDDIFVQVPESISFVDTATMPHDSHCFWNCTLCKATHDGMS
ncbi:hypothetical protein NC653_002614 [Populus alba x Populus x berolinensis]|uniref:DCD domain-containing protein n=1 Tax=Populus alba x Populus x berolinensis TaxID=444605 RepID=A0AAD6RPB4_9ROSI|nr:hypothetical protein NC653_002614 [Populus alba x Populus x berolinensis]